MFPGTHTNCELHVGLRTLDESTGILCEMKCGDCVLMDSRLMHCGTANTSDIDRFLFYSSWGCVGGDTCGSTDTLLDSYVNRLLLSEWRHWTKHPPEVELPSVVGPEVPVGSESRKQDDAISAEESEVRLVKKRHRQETSAALTGDAHRRLEVFLSWLRSHGVDLATCGVTIRSSQKHGCGVFACRRLHPGETLARIPDAATLHAGKVCQSEFGQVALSALGEDKMGCTEILPEELLWLYMIWGRQALACPWYEYLQMLSLESPLSWMNDEAALSWVEGTPLSVAVSQKLDQQRSRYARIVGKLSALNAERFPKELFGFDDWLWAQSTCRSRAFNFRAFPSESQQPGWESDILCPVLDVFNHTHTAQIEWRFGERSAALVLPVCADAYEEGDEMFNLYGTDLGNAHLLMHYGFAVEGNPHDCVEEVAFDVASDVMAARLASLASSAVCLPVTGVDCAVKVRLPQGMLRRGMLETPVALLRAASILMLGRDYDEETASCADKEEVCTIIARTLRRMSKQIGRSAGVPGSPASQRHRTWKAGRFAIATRSQIRCNAATRSKRSCHRECVSMPTSGVQRAAAIYALSQRRILRFAAKCAADEAEMAKLAAQMDLRRQEADEESSSEETQCNE